MAKYYFKLLILMAILLPMGFQAAWADHAKIEYIGGADKVAVKRDGKMLELKKEDLLQPGDELSTDGHTAADIRLDDQTLVRVGVNSTYKIVQSEGSSKFIHRLFSGIVRVLVPVRKESKTGEIKFNMKTPQGTIGVRGTEFTVEIAKGETILRGLSGEVQFGPADADFADTKKFVYVGRGMQSSVANGKAASKPTKYNLEKYLKEMDGAAGPFGKMAKRSNLNLIRRGEKPADDSTSEGAKVAVASAEGATKGGGQALSIGQSKAETTAPTVKGAKAAAKASEKRSLENQLLDAIDQKRFSKVSALLDRKVEVNYRDAKGATPLHYAVISADLKIVQLLIMKGADVNAVTKFGVTPLMQVAVDNVPVVIADLLVQNDADPTLKNNEGITALNIAEAKTGDERDEELIAFLRKISP